jgi:hypothetical protein
MDLMDKTKFKSVLKIMTKPPLLVLGVHFPPKSYHSSYVIPQPLSKKKFYAYFNNSFMIKLRSTWMNLPLMESLLMRP